jgi:hypothetical protein
MMLNPDENSRTYSSVYNDLEYIGWSMLFSRCAWAHDESDSDTWMYIDAGEEVSIAGISIQSR